MKKQLVFLIAVFMTLVQTPTCVCAKTSLSTPVKIAIKKYKTGNYTGCLQDCQNIVTRDPSNSIAYYYIAMSYVQAGQQDNALAYYAKVLNSTPNAILRQYAQTGKRCLETPDQCRLGTDNSDIDRFIAKPGGALSDSVKQGIEKNNIDEIRNEMNLDQDINPYEFNKFKDFSNKHSQAETGDKMSKKTPTNDEIVAALKVLKAAGLNPYSQNASAEMVTPKMDMQASNYQNADLTALNMFMGRNGQSNPDNTMLNMLPALAAQNKDGTSNYSPQMMQAVIMNSMMSNMNFNMDEDKDK